MALGRSTSRRVALANMRNLVAQALYLRLGVDITRPVQTYGLLTTRCNARCKMCSYWRTTPKDELPASVWIRFLKRMEEFSPGFTINFSGGEPLLRTDIFEILESCRSEGIAAGIITNGLLLTKTNVPRLVDASLFNINVSLDSMEDNIHDGMRGVDGILRRARYGLDNLMETIERTKSSTRVIIKSIVSAENMAGLPKVVEFAKEIGAAGIGFQPIIEWSEECKQMSQVDIACLTDTIDSLVEMKRDGYPVLNSEASMRQWVNYYQGTPPKNSAPCVVALRDLFIDPNGDCSSCMTVLGNIARNDIRDIWFAPKSRKTRAALVRCRKLCLCTCVVKRSMKDYLYLFSRFAR